ncbi:MAG: patatin-like phospholipase family protein [Chloroflexota bacterium]
MPRPTVGLVLGAGGIRGCAHAAVISVLREAGIPIDLVVGASTGALFGLGVAAGLDANEVAGVVSHVKTLDVVRFYLGGLRPSRSNPVGRLLLEAGADRNLEDMDIPFAVQATDMADLKPIVIRRGPALPAVQASIALPLITRPVEIGGRLHLDGGLQDTAPVSVAREMGADVVICVCLGHNFSAPAALRRRPWTQGVLETVGRAPARGNLPTQLRFLSRLYAASFQPVTPATDADITIWPEFGKIGPNSMVGGGFCYRQGLEAARQALPDIQRVLQAYRPKAG